MTEKRDESTNPSREERGYRVPPPPPKPKPTESEKPKE
jgi:hypothetical protein